MKQFKAPWMSLRIRQDADLFMVLDDDGRQVVLGVDEYTGARIAALPELEAAADMACSLLDLGNGYGAVQIKTVYAALDPLRAALAKMEGN